MVTLCAVRLRRWHSHSHSPPRKVTNKKMPLTAFPAESQYTYHLLPTLVLPRSGSSGRRHGSRPLSPVARAPVCIFVVQFTPARRLLSTPMPCVLTRLVV